MVKDSGEMAGEQKNGYYIQFMIKVGRNDDKDNVQGMVLYLEIMKLDMIILCYCVTKPQQSMTHGF